MTFALGVLPVVLLLIGFPIYSVMLASMSVALVATSRPESGRCHGTTR